MNKTDREHYAYKYRNLAPYQRLDLAFEKLYQAQALLEDEVMMQDTYHSMDFGTLPTGHYKSTIKEIKGAIMTLQHESLLEKKKECPKGTLSKNETIEYLLAIDEQFCIEPSVMRNAIYSAVGYLKRRAKDEITVD